MCIAVRLLEAGITLIEAIMKFSSEESILAVKNEIGSKSIRNTNESNSILTGVQLI